MKRFLPAALAIALLPFAAQAGDLSYNYFQAGYGYSHNDPSDSHSHLWRANGSVAVGDHFAIIGGGNVVDHDGTDTSGQGWSLGGNFHTPISAQTDFIANASYGHSNIDGVSGHVNTYSGTLGVRSGLTPHVEGWVEAGYSNSQNDLGDISRGSQGRVFGLLGGQYKFNKNIGLVAEGNLGKDNRGIFVGPRISF